MHSSQISPDQLQELREAFSLFDKEGDGSITTNHLPAVMRSLGQLVNVDKMQKLIMEMDPDGNGSVDFSEFVTMMAPRLPAADDDEPKKKKQENRLTKAFKRFDTDDKGVISAAELREMMTSLGEKLTEEEADEMLRDADVDGDGQIDYAAFVQLLMNA
eukprot:gnl/Spiro4/8413_TR4415_c0_g1_i1.p2 gnl/Spiro4/8413_TR4415_c0_g1~~gnl/Spiro4/8413_TR4415_c0_g1_i1.p2  ORF type:complete len:173 (-),score=51.72 gnl/Spiro4/8413_TR4415_c0_g1_i1:116-592(-)